MSVAKCKTTRTHSVYGMHAAQCADGEIRLSGFEESEVGNWTEGSVDGRVEVCSSNLTWRVLCEPEGGWKPEDAAVVCRQLGHSPLGKDIACSTLSDAYTGAALCTCMQQEMFCKIKIILAIE